MSQSGLPHRSALHNGERAYRNKRDDAKLNTTRDFSLEVPELNAGRSERGVVHGKTLVSISILRRDEILPQR
jgi:hypothetical protein